MSSSGSPSAGSPHVPPAGDQDAHPGDFSAFIVICCLLFVLFGLNWGGSYEPLRSHCNLCYYLLMNQSPPAETTEISQITRLV